MLHLTKKCIEFQGGFAIIPMKCKNKELYVNMKEENKRGLNSENIWTTIYCCCLFVLFPLFMRDGYLDIMEAKTKFFLVTTGIYLAGMLIIAVVKKIQEGTDIFVWKRISFTDIFCLALVVNIFSGLLLNKFNSEVLWASKGKLFGCIFLEMCCMIYFFISRTFRMNQGILWGLLLGNIFTAFFVVCSRFGVDIFHLYDIIVKNQRSAFLGTLGQINVVASFFCVFIPFWMGCYLSAKERTSKILFGIALFFALTAGFSSNSDSIFLGIVGAYLFYLWSAFADGERLSAYFQCGSLLFLSIFSVGFLTYLAKHNLHFTVKWDLLQQQILKYSLLWLGVAVFLGICPMILKNILKKIDLKDSLKKRRTFLLMIVVVIMILAVFIVAMNSGILKNGNAFGKHSVCDDFLENNDIGSCKVFLGKYILFNDSWGSNRGYVWKRTFQLFGQLPVWKKIMGCGMGMFPSFFEAFHTEAMKQFGYYFVDAHNEFLQFLVTTGIIGCISYFGMIITTLIKNLLFIRNKGERERPENELSIIVPAILFVWLLQGLVNSPTVFITPYLFIFLGIGRNIVTE